MNTTKPEPSEPVAGPVQRTVRPTDDAELLAELHAQRERLRNRLSDLQTEINAVRVRISEAKKQERESAKKTKPSIKRRNVSMLLDAIHGATVAQVAQKYDLSTERARQCIDKVLRMSMHPSRWDATGGAEHPRKLRAARLRPEPLASVLRGMLDEA